MKNRVLKATTLLTLILTGLVNSNICAQNTNSLYFLENSPINSRLNPAMAPKYTGFGIGLSNFSFSFQSDIAVNDLFYPGDNGELYTFMHPEVDKDMFLSRLNDNSMVKTTSSIDLFNLGVRINRRHYLSVHTGINFDFGVGIPKDAFRLLLKGMETDQAVTNFDMSKLSLDAMVYSKTGVSFATSPSEFISIGVGVNRLQGFANINMGFDKFTVDASQTQWNIISKGYFQFTGPEEVAFSYSEDGYLNGIESGFEMNSSGELSNTAYSVSKVGSGYSVDLGVTIRPIDILKLSASLTDIGSLNWNKEYIQRAKSDGSFTYDGTDLNELVNNDSQQDDGIKLDEELQQLTHFTKDVNVDSYKSKLTTKLNIGAELGSQFSKITLGVLSQTGFASNGKYTDLMVAANFKPGSLIQAALTYSLLHGETNSFGAAANIKLLFFNLHLSADYIPTTYTTNMMPVGNSYYNMQMGLNFMF